VTESLNRISLSFGEMFANSAFTERAGVCGLGLMNTHAWTRYFLSA
jgi:hypothetical protein